MNPRNVLPRALFLGSMLASAASIVLDRSKEWRQPQLHSIFIFHTQYL
jgi:hypothetical protein